MDLRRINADNSTLYTGRLWSSTGSYAAMGGPVGTSFKMRPRSDKDIHTKICGGWITMSLNGLPYRCIRENGQSEEVVISAHNVSQCGEKGCDGVVISCNILDLGEIPKTYYTGDNMRDPNDF